MSASNEIYDIVVTGHDDEIKFIKRLVDSLRQANFTVWYPEKSYYSDRVSQAILGCKVYVPVLSELWAEDKLFNDELALAYISNSAIFPVGLKSFPEISNKLDGGSKLILARINWTILENISEYEKCANNLIKSIRQQLESINAREISEDIGISGYIETHGLVINTQFSHNSNEDNEDEPEDLGNTTPTKSKEKSPPKTPKALDFWDRHFKNRSEVQWTEFKDKFHQDYDNKILELFHEKEQKLFKNLMYRDIFNLNKTIQRGVYDRFCNKNPQADPHCFYNRLQEYVIAHMSLRKVFNMNSTLRITTIQNLGQFSFPAIVQGLTEMLKDDDPNIRAVAAIALAKSGKNRSDTVDKLVGLLEDEDRLVRESSLLSLGYLKAVKAVDHVVNRWRNDPISTVREAASLALKRMNIEEAQKCIKVTEVLSQEMSALKPQ
ncbi:hypothetical protein LOTGIDRAFT_236148 [Lottia gigantea]|uniref:TIR domain-containing protein n=1 Tax=Lottia gigantea TaxID=225164 RepID=V4B7M4_LOTGI|nr:hypothetical protein LOTGIDRAFT_236148 [Lottia gigantea]ESO84624.1 hypothetical protein LOTGIDRAFT_236148 [Lottia gigantea]